MTSAEVADKRALSTSRPRLIGRHADVAALRRLIGHSCVLTLLGLPGIGKTALLELLAGAAFPNPADEQPIVVEGLADLFGSSTYFVDQSTATHAAVVATVRALRDARPGVRVVVASRRPLCLAGEQQYRLFGLAGPKPAADVRACRSAPAVAFLTERARLVQPDFSITAGNMPAVTALVNELGGHPVALGLTALHLQMLEPAELLERVSRGFDLGRNVEGPGGHRFVSLATIAETALSALDPPARALLDRVACLEAPFSLSCTEAVCDSEGIRHRPVASVVMDLVEASAIEVVVGATRRYRVAPIVRRYVRCRVPPPIVEEVAERTTMWCIDVAESAEPHLYGPQRQAWLAALRQEEGIVFSSIRWAAAVGRSDHVARLTGAMWAFWIAEGKSEAARSSLLDALRGAQPRLSKSSTVPPWMGWTPDGRLRDASSTTSALAFELRNAGLRAYLVGDNARANQLMTETLRLYRDAKNGPGVFITLFLLTSLAIDRLVDRHGGEKERNPESAYSRTATLLGACEALRDVLGDALRPQWGQVLAAATVRGRNVAGPGFDGAFQTGKALPLDAVIDVALDVRTALAALAKNRRPRVNRGSADLTAREREVARLVATGMSNREIAEALAISERTAETHVEHILSKLGFTSRSRIVAWILADDESNHDHQ